MDDKTLEFYRENAAEIADRYDAAQSGIAQFFREAFVGRKRIVDVGCGTGRDLNALLEMGFDAIGIDPCAELLAQAAQKYPKTAGKMHVDVLPDLKTLQNGREPTSLKLQRSRGTQRAQENDAEPKSLSSLRSFAAENEEKVNFDGILCSSVLMHLPEELLFDSIYALRGILKPKGRLLMSVPLEDDTIDERTHRDANDRLFNGVAPEKFQLLFERVGFKLVNRWDNDDSLGRGHRRWATMLFELVVNYW